MLVQRGAGVGSSIGDEAYAAQGATIVADAAEVFGGAELIVKVKEPQESEVALLEFLAKGTKPRRSKAKAKAAA